MTWFERIQACGTPKALAALLRDGGKRVFCPYVSDIDCSLKCRACIAAWLEEGADDPPQDEKSAHPDGHPK